MLMTTTSLIQINAKHFCAGIIVDEKGVVVKTAPILKYMIGWHINRVKAYTTVKKWGLIKCNGTTQKQP